jgi:hypothetical protein
LTEFYDCGDAMDVVIMVTCPTNLKFNTTDPATHDTGKRLLRKLYNAKKGILTIMTLGMDSSHCLAVIQKIFEHRRSTREDLPSG